MDLPNEILIQIVGAEDTTPEELAELTQQLRDDLLKVDVDFVRPPGEGAASTVDELVDPFSLGSMIIAWSAAGGVFSKLIDVLQAWTTRNEKHSVTVTEPGGATITIQGHSTPEEQATLEMWAKQQAALFSAN